VGGVRQDVKTSIFKVYKVLSNFHLSGLRSALSVLSRLLGIYLSNYPKIWDFKRKLAGSKENFKMWFLEQRRNRLALEILNPKLLPAQAG